MLVLSRKIGESVRIGEGIVVTVLGCTAGRVRLGVEAEREVKIVRGELFDKGMGAAQPSLKHERIIECQ